MFKFGFGATTGFIGGMLFFAKGLQDVYKRDGDLSKIEDIIRRNVEKARQAAEGNESLGNLEVELKRLLNG